MSLAPLPEEILDRFRTSSRNRLDQVESAWKSLTQGLGSEELARETHRNVHTLKGDARMVQFHDIDLVCQKLEDLLALADSHRYRVSHDLDLMVTMALDFIGLLLRRRGDQEVGGINLQGFVAQVHQVLRQEQSGLAGAVPGLSLVEPSAFSSGSERLSDGTRGRLAVAATKVFLEYLSASGAARTRLRSAWTDLQRSLQRFDSEAVTPLLERHARAIPEVAASVGVEVEIKLDLGAELRVSSESLEALDIALMHGIRNALSHGIEPPEERRTAGKSVQGYLEIRTHLAGDKALVCIRDDGRGIDLESIRRRAVDTGAMHPDVARDAGRDDLLELLFQPRFTTRLADDGVAGRGIGLDALRSAVRKAGGEVRIDGSPGQGTILSVELLLVRRQVAIHAFDAYGGRLVLAVPPEWQSSWMDLREHKKAGRAEPIDPIASLHIRRPEDDTGLVAAGLPQILCLSRGARQVDLVATRSSRVLVGERICPTPDTFPVEVVTVEGVEVLLLRPDVLPSQVSGLVPESESL